MPPKHAGPLSLPEIELVSSSPVSSLPSGLLNRTPRVRDIIKSMSEPTKPPSPDLFWQAVNGFQLSGAIRAAIDLDLFTVVGEGADTVSAAAARLSAPERGVRILLDFLTVQGFFEKSDSRYVLTRDSATFLDKRSPAYLGGITEFLQLEQMRGNFWELADIVRRGTVPPSRPDAFGVEHPMWVAFARAMGPIMAPLAEFLAGFAAEEAGDRLRTLDIAAGHGLFGIQVAKTIRHAEVTAVDWPGVLAVAQENAKIADVSDRHSLCHGDAFKAEFGGDYDLVLVTNFFHHFDKPTCVSLMKRLHGALRPGGRLFTLEFVPNEDRVTPPNSATFPLVMLANTPAGDAYTFSEYDSMLTEAGFTGARAERPPMAAQTLIISRRP